jgi:Flp pilus assembly protein TadD
MMWIDLARSYTLVSEREKARDAMRRAIILAPVNRFTLRSAARLFLHQGDPERAARVLQKNEATAHDPWLLAAEVAVSTILGKSSQFLKLARLMLGAGKYAAWHLNELASALGTVELNEGNRRGARKRPRTYEARAWERYVAGDWSAALVHAKDWLRDEPFSTRPAYMGTFVGSVLLEDYSTSVRIAQFALRANPDDQTLRNNLVFALASSGAIGEALEEARKVERDKVRDHETAVAWTATTGLLAFRLGVIDEGRSLYRTAIQLAEKLPLHKAYAAAFLAREEIIASTREAPQALELAVRASGEVKSAALDFLLTRLEQLVTPQSSSAPDPRRL